MYVEEYINLKELLSDKTDRSEDYCVGIINVSGYKVGFIVNTFLIKS